jgi:thymidylate kinase
VIGHRGKLICFTGIDGAGKTTLAKHLVNTLRLPNGRFKYVYGRFLPKLVKPFWSIGRYLFLNSRNTTTTGYIEYSDTKKRVLGANKILGKFHEYILMFDYWTQMLIKVELPLLFGKSIICDRYLYDTVITDLAPDLGYTDDLVIKKIEHFLHFIPRPDFVFILDVPENISMKRKDDVPHIKYLNDRRILYKELRSRFGFFFIDGSSPLEENMALVSKVAQDFLDGVKNDH